MSLECSICEHDVRGGHAEDCPLYDGDLVCICGCLKKDHDEEGYCQECFACFNFVAKDESNG